MSGEKEKAGALDALIGEASANADIAGAGAVPGAEGAPIQPGPSPDQIEREAWIDKARQGCGLVTALFPALRDDWKPEYVAAFGAALADTAKHYGWSAASAAGHPLVALTIAAIPLGLPAWEKIIKPKLDQSKRDKGPLLADSAKDAGQGAPGLLVPKGSAPATKAKPGKGGAALPPSEE